MSRQNKIYIFLIAIVLSLVGGIIGGILVRSYFLNSSFNVPLIGDINVGSDYQNGSLIISKPNKVIVEQNDRITQVIIQAQDSIISFYNKKVITENAGYYNDQSSIGEGLVLTSDGWIVTTTTINKSAAFVAIDANDNILDISQTIFDDTTGLWFVKVDKTDLVAVAFAEYDIIQPGQLILALSDGVARLTYIEDVAFINTTASILTSDILYRFMKVADESLSNGDVIFGLNGAVLGIYSRNGLVTPVKHITMLLPTLLNEHSTTRKTIGIGYSILYNSVGLEGRLNGVVVKSIKRRSLAASSDLIIGDTILAVNGVVIDKQNPFSELIQTATFTNNIDLLVERGGGEININIAVE